VPILARPTGLPVSLRLDVCHCLSHIVANFGNLSCQNRLTSKNKQRHLCLWHDNLPQMGMAMSLSWEDVLQKLLTQPTVSVPEAGLALGNLSRNAAYEAAAAGKLGVPVHDAGGKKRVASTAVLRVLGLDQGSAPVPIVKGRRVRPRKTATRAPATI
jgi:hypothetical protein